ncbi:MAG: hypothetical protein KDE27_16355 [Planctomycetes bacterium]|nr:hypothetical protein [Planctomycetota bacterium]
MHSFSTRGFASGRVEEVSEAAYECAASGIDVCYFCMSGDVGAPPSDKSPSDARKELVNSFRAAGEDLRRTSRLSTSGDPRLWCVTPRPGAEDDSLAAQVFGSAVHVLTIIRSTAGEPANVELSDWDRIVPSSFMLEQTWLHVQEKRGGSIQPRWIRLGFTDQLDSRYYPALSRLRQDGTHEVSRILH